MQNSSIETDLIPLSWLSQYGYCPRRCGLLALNQAWEENAETASGRIQHERVHTARIERKGADIFLYEMNVFSRALGVNGKCDCVEAHESPEGIELPYGEGRYLLYPIEYKHGVVRQEEEYHIQLCAQAICLEELYGGSITKGAIFYINAHRRDEVELSSDLRKKTFETSERIQEMLMNEIVPIEKYNAKCKKCSMISVCQPKLKHTAKNYNQSLWNTVLEKEVR